MKEIVTFKIHPAIGIARIGNSPDKFFIGPELPGVNNPPNGGYKDAQMRVKRQAARFRIFGYDEAGNVVKEITSKDADIKWTVHLANKKAVWKEFDGLNPNTPLRNASEKNRNKLIIDPGERTLNKINSSALFDTGIFYDKTVPLGEMRMDKNGRLLLLGGFGNSASIHNKPPKDYANNNGWHDDVSDGPVTALVKLKGSSKFETTLPAWVICPPCDFAPSLGNVISLYDTLLQVAIDKLNYELPDIPSFSNDIYPILSRANNMKWVSMMMWTMHRKHGTKPASMESKHKDMEDSNPLIIDAALRQKIFDKLTDPSNPLAGEDNDMPMLWSDYYDEQTRDNGEPRNLTLCQWQYDYLDKWAKGLFNDDWAGVPAPRSVITAAGLDKAALENCIGGAFYPGIEASWYTRDHYDFIEPFRLSHTLLSAGDITKQMALPWQADFYDCRQEEELSWWPAQRPDDVFVEGNPNMHKWTRWHVTNYQGMVDKWHHLGFVIKKGEGYIESERNP
jgi:hypothetical protein